MMTVSGQKHVDTLKFVRINLFLDGEVIMNSQFLLFGK